MAAGSEHEFLLPNWRLWRVDHLRSVKDGSKGRWARLLRAVQSLACLLLLLGILRVLGQGLLMGVAGAALVLLLQEAWTPHRCSGRHPGKRCNCFSAELAASITFGFIGHRNWLVNRLAYPRKSMALPWRTDSF